MQQSKPSPRIVLITGGSRGIGASCVKKFSKNGDKVAFLYHTHKDEALAVAEETGAFMISADVSDPSSVSEAIKEIEQRLGPISVLVNNAGISQIGLFTDLKNEEWDRIIGVNLSASFYTTRAVAPAMIQNKYGRIIEIGSMWGKVGASCEVAYSASKAGLRGLTMALAKELGPSGITVNCIEPGVIDTDMNHALDTDTLEELRDETPLSRLGNADEVADAVLFLASDQASFITGQIIGVDGGFAV